MNYRILAVFLILGMFAIGLANAGTISVSLTSPSNGAYSSYTNPQTFVGSITTNTSVQNVTLYHNSTGTWTAIQTIPYNSTTYEVATITSDSGWSSQAGIPDRAGMVFVTKTQPIMVYNVTKPSSSTDTTVSICTSSSCTTSYGSATFSGNVATFSSPIQLNASTTYYLASYKGGSSRTIYYKTITVPVETSYFNYTGSFGDSNNCGGATNRACQIIDMGVSQGSQNVTVTGYSNVTPSVNTSWNFLACDYSGNCTFATSNFTLISRDLLLNSQNYNSTTYETASESLSVVISANSSLSNVWLNWNGTSYLATNNSGTWSTNAFDIPEGVANKSMNWIFNYAGSNVSGDTFYQYVNNTFFTLCNSSFTDEFLNISFTDETAGTKINASITESSFEYYLGTGTVTKTYTYSNSGLAFNYTFCGYPARTLYVKPSIQYKQGTAYPQRIWSPTVQSYTSTVTNQALYLLGLSSGLYVTFQIVNVAQQPLPNIGVLATRSISGTDTTVCQGTTGSDGSVTCWLNPDFTHDFTFSSSLYEDYETSFVPTQSSYTVQLGGTAAQDVNYLQGVSMALMPTGTTLEPSTSYTFQFVLSSQYWNVTSFGFSLTNVTGTILASNSSSSDGGTVSYTLNTSSNTSIVMNYYYLTNGTYQNFTRTWRVFDTSVGNYSISHLFDDIETYSSAGIFGMDSFTIAFLTFIVIFVFTGVVSYQFGISNPAAIVGIVFALVLFFDVGVGLIPNVGGAHFVSILVGIVTAGMIFREVTR